MDDSHQLSSSINSKLQISMPRRFMRLSRIFPEIKRAVREHNRFDEAAAKIHAAALNNNLVSAEFHAVTLVRMIADRFSIDFEERYLAEVHQRWGHFVDVQAIVSDFGIGVNKSAFATRNGSSHDAWLYNPRRSRR